MEAVTSPRRELPPADALARADGRSVYLEIDGGVVAEWKMASRVTADAIAGKINVLLDGLRRSPTAPTCKEPGPAVLTPAFYDSAMGKLLVVRDDELARLTAERDAALAALAAFQRQLLDLARRIEPDVPASGPLSRQR